MTADGHSKGNEDLEESFNPSTGSDANDTDARVEADITRILSDGNLDDAELDQLTNELATFDHLPPEERDERRKRFLTEFHREVVRVEATNGPLPPPTMLAGYEEALPGAADRILKMAEAQQAHRLSIEDKVIDGNIVSERIGTVVGGVVALVAIIGAMVLIAIGKSVEGLALVILEAAGVAAVFLKTRAEGGKELQAKRRQADSNDITGP